MTLEEYTEERRKRAAKWMLLDCANEKINGGWIPISEKRPVEFEKVLVTYRLHYDDSIHVGIGNIITNYVNGRYHWNINEQDYIGWDILAWMPLPQPYKAESEGINENDK